MCGDTAFPINQNLNVKRADGICPYDKEIQRTKCIQLAIGEYHCAAISLVYSSRSADIFGACTCADYIRLAYS